MGREREREREGGPRQVLSKNCLHLKFILPLPPQDIALTIPGNSTIWVWAIWNFTTAMKSLEQSKKDVSVPQKSPDFSFLLHFNISTTAILWTSISFLALRKIWMHDLAYTFVLYRVYIICSWLSKLRVFTMLIACPSTFTLTPQGNQWRPCNAVQSRDGGRHQCRSRHSPRQSGMVAFCSTSFGGDGLCSSIVLFVATPYLFYAMAQVITEAACPLIPV